MVTRIWDPASLDKAADFTMELAIPESSYPEKNPDGTAPVTSLKVEGSSIRFALQALKQVNENETMLDVVLNDLLDDSVADFTDEEMMKYMAEHDEEVVDSLEKTHNPFIDFGFAVDDGEGQKLTVTLTAPSGLIAFQSFQAMTNDKKLNALATSFMPLDNDDDSDEDWYN
jgi:hypothetical protein